MLAVPASAAPPRSHAPEMLPLRTQDGPLRTVVPDDVIRDGVIIGRDPDPAIRASIQRGYGVTGP